MLHYQLAGAERVDYMASFYCFTCNLVKHQGFLTLKKCFINDIF